MFEVSGKANAKNTWVLVTDDSLKLAFRNSIVAFLPGYL